MIINPNAHRPLSRDIRRFRAAAAQQVFAHFNGVIQAGPMKGVRMPTKVSWGGADLTKKIFGLYESQLYPPLIAGRGGALVDIGAADGYWGVGLVAAGFFERALCFEARPFGHEAMREMADANGVADKIDIRGEASAASIADILDYVGDEADPFFIIDVEGAEYDLIENGLLDDFPNARAIIELHPRFAGDRSQPDEDLIDRVSGAHDAVILNGEACDLSPLADAIPLHDDLKWVLASEGRNFPMRWLHLSPKAG